MLAAIEQAAIEENTRWTPEREMAATNAELLHQLIIVSLKVAGVKREIRPLHIERPWDKQAKARVVQIGFGQFAGMIGAKNG